MQQKPTQLHTLVMNKVCCVKQILHSSVERFVRVMVTITKRIIQSLHRTLLYVIVCAYKTNVIVCAYKTNIRTGI